MFLLQIADVKKMFANICVRLDVETFIMRINVSDIRYYVLSRIGDMS